MTVRIRCRKGGPLVIEGDVDVEGYDGDVLERFGDRILLCRCGASATAPRCDGSHNRVRFEVDDPPTP